jgi:DNA-binding transcriptional LysR family regulator
MRTQTVTGAASQLKIAQPTVTRTIRRIEDVLGVQLFDRSGGRLTPTAEARRVLEEVDRAFADLEQAIGRAARVAHESGGTFRLGASPSVGRVLLPRVIAGLVRARRGLSIQFEVLSVSQMLDYLVGGPGAAVVTLFPVAHGGIHSALVGTGQLVAVVPKAFLQASRTLITPHDLAEVTLIALEPHSVHGQMMSYFLSTGSISPRRTHLVRFAESAIAFAEAGIGLALVDEFSALSADARRVTIVPTTCERPFQVYLNRNLARPQSQFIPLLEAGLRAALSTGASTLVGGADGQSLLRALREKGL